ncbi:MAG: arylesterase, partial [Gemmatimonadaceae bacterium]|nr:arylesterase [Gemmatimonadaceae bacterium]
MRVVKGGLVGLLFALACSGGGGGGGGGAAAGTARDVATDSAGRKTPGAGESPASMASGRVVLFLGTSLTAGLGLDPDSAYPMLVQRKLDAKGLSYRVVNAGVSGETSAGLLRRLDWVLQQPVAVIVVETGANDGLRGLPVAATRTTISQILARIHRDRPEARVVLAQMEAPPNLGPTYTKAFHAMFPALAAEHGAVLMPFLLARVAGRPALNQADGIH